MPPAAAVPSYDQAYGSLGSVYDPQVAQVNTEIGQLPGQQQVQQSALDQAKVNAFRDITTAANNKGMLFSGFTPDQQAQYVGTKYLPAVANLQTSFQNNKNTLLEKINQINATRASQAQGIVSSANTAANDNYYKNAQLQLGYARLNSSNARANAGKTPTQGQVMQQDMATTAQNLQSKAGKDGHVSQTTWNKAMGEWTAAGYSPADFTKNYMQFVNQRYGGYHGYS